MHLYVLCRRSLFSLKYLRVQIWKNAKNTTFLCVCLYCTYVISYKYIWYAFTFRISVMHSMLNLFKLTQSIIILSVDVYTYLFPCKGESSKRIQID